MQIDLEWKIDCITPRGNCQPKALATFSKQCSGCVAVSLSFRTRDVWISVDHSLWQPLVSLVLGRMRALLICGDVSPHRSLWPYLGLCSACSRNRKCSWAAAGSSHSQHRMQKRKVGDGKRRKNGQTATERNTQSPVGETRTSRGPRKWDPGTAMQTRGRKERPI